MASSQSETGQHMAGMASRAGTEWTPSQQPVEYYRAAAARARSLEQDATTPRVKQHLRELIDRYERLAGEVERTSEKDLNGKADHLPQGGLRPRGDLP